MVESAWRGWGAAGKKARSIYRADQAGCKHINPILIEIEGTRYSHIIDPATGLGPTRQVAATVVAPTATLSDAIATACCVADPEEAQTLAIARGARDVHMVVED